jgi:hypothetical protein
MKKMLVSLGLLLSVATNAEAEMVAWLGNQAGGRIVITDEVCVDPDTKKRYDQLKRAYNYGASGSTSEGCFTIEDDSVVIVWVNTNGRNKSRYPLENFTLNPNYKKNSRGGSGGYNY